MTRRKIILSVIGTVLLIILSILGKCYITYMLHTGEDPWYTDVFFSDITLERFVYGIDVLLSVIYSTAIIKKTIRLFPKILLSIGVTIGNLLWISLFNYTWMCVQMNEEVMWKDYTVSIFDCVRSGLSYYFETGQPRYHILLIVVFIICISISLLVHYDLFLEYAVADFILKRMAKCDDAYKLIAYHNLLIDHFKSHFSRKTLNELKEQHIRLQKQVMELEMEQKYN